MKEETRNSKVLRSFVKYCEENPEYRFWQALLGWSGLPYVCWTTLTGKDILKGEGGDTFYWEGRTENND